MSPEIYTRIQGLVDLPLLHWVIISLWIYRINNKLHVLSSAISHTWVNILNTTPHPTFPSMKRLSGMERDFFKASSLKGDLGNPGWVLNFCCCCLVSVVFYPLWPHGLQHTRLRCPSLSTWVCSNSCPLSRGCHPAISSSVIPFSSWLQSFRVSGSFPMNWLCIRWPKYQSFSFSISPSNEYWGLISFRRDWFDLLADSQDSQESSPAPQFKSINSLVLSLYGPTLTSIHDYWKNHSLDYMDICWQSDVSVI